MIPIQENPCHDEPEKVGMKLPYSSLTKRLPTSETCSGHIRGLDKMFSFKAPLEIEQLIKTIKDTF